MAGASPGQLQDAEGVVKWFDARKGYGFIVGPEGQDVFVHFTAIEGTGFLSLKDDMVVRYDAEHTDKGWKASRVARVGVVGVPAVRKGYTRSPRR